MQILIWTYTATDKLAWSNTIRLYVLPNKQLRQQLYLSPLCFLADVHWQFFFHDSSNEIRRNPEPGETHNTFKWDGDSRWNSAELFISWDGAWKRHVHTHEQTHMKSECPLLPYFPQPSMTAFQIKAVVSECCMSYWKTPDCTPLWLSEMSDALRKFILLARWKVESAIYLSVCHSSSVDCFLTLNFKMYCSVLNNAVLKMVQGVLLNET